MGAAIVLMAGCGGGGGDNNQDEGEDTSVSIELNPSNEITMSTNSSRSVVMNSLVRRDSTKDTKTITEMQWYVKSLNNEIGIPVLSNSNCVDKKIVDAFGYCKSVLSIPKDLQNGTWEVVAVANASNGDQHTERFTLNINSDKYDLTAGESQVVKGVSYGVFPIVDLNGYLGGNHTSKISKVRWIQKEGPVVQVGNNDNLEASFVPNEGGIYVFELEVEIDDLTIKSPTTVIVYPAAP